MPGLDFRFCVGTRQTWPIDNRSGSHRKCNREGTETKDASCVLDSESKLYSSAGNTYQLHSCLVSKDTGLQVTVCYFFTGKDYWEKGTTLSPKLLPLSVWKCCHMHKHAAVCGLARGIMAPLSRSHFAVCTISGLGFLARYRLSAQVQTGILLFWSHENQCQLETPCAPDCDYWCQFVSCYCQRSGMSKSKGVGFILNSEQCM